LRDRDLVRLYWPVELRLAFDALMDIDNTMAEVVVRSTQPALAAIKLAWWRDALNGLDRAAPPREPRLMAVSRHLLPLGISRTALAAIPVGWAALLDEEPDPEAIVERGTGLFAVGAGILRATSDRLLEAGSLVAFADAKRLGFGTFPHSTWPMRFPRSVRPLTALAALAARDLRQDHIEHEGTAGRAWTIFRHWLTGRIG
jgi:phytoene synthase